MPFYGGGGGSSSVPAGTIAMWAGTLASVPSGWNLCDGTSGTPDLRGQFIKGWAAGVDPGTTGGSATTTATGSVAAPTFTGSSVTSGATGAGTPAGTIDAHTTNVFTGTGATTLLTGPTTHTFTGSAMGTHTHSVSAAGTNSAPAFTGNAVNSEPPYYKLAYIQKS